MNSAQGTKLRQNAAALPRERDVFTLTISEAFPEHLGAEEEECQCFECSGREAAEEPIVVKLFFSFCSPRG